jgi:hypothetical protein
MIEVSSFQGTQQITCLSSYSRTETDPVPTVPTVHMKYEARRSLSECINVCADLFVTSSCKPFGFLQLKSVDITPNSLVLFMSSVLVWTGSYAMGTWSCLTGGKVAGT